MSLWFLQLCTLLYFTRLVNTCSNQVTRKMPCQPPWLAFQDSCYLAVTKKRNYFGAERHCQSYSQQGGPAHLASIRSQEENNFVGQYVLSVFQDVRFNIWIGYNDLAEEGNYTWLDGSPVGYENWRPGFPVGDRFGNQDCIHLHLEKKWKEFFCGGAMYSVCKMPGIMTSKPASGFNAASTCRRFCQ